MSSFVNASPSISSTSGTISNGQIITIFGSGFGTENTTNYIANDNYDNPTHWPASGYDGSPYAFSNWGNSGKSPTGIWSNYSTTTWQAFFDGEGSDKSNPPSLSATTAASNFSTGWGCRKHILRVASSVGVEGGSLATYPSGHSEIWIRYYQRFSKDMSTREEESKQMYIYLHDTYGNPYIMPHMYASGGTFKWRTYYNTSSNTTCFYGSVNGDCWGNGSFYASYPGANKWQEIKIRVKVNGANGIYQEWIDGVQVINLNPVNLGSTNVGMIRFGANFSGGNTDLLNVGETLEEDWSNIVVSTSNPGSIAAVFLSNSSTWAGYSVGSVNWCNGTSTFIRQVVGGTTSNEKGFNAWTDTQFKFQANLGSLDISKPIYLYITNWSGETNSTGFTLGTSQNIEPEAISTLRFK